LTEWLRVVGEMIGLLTSLAIDEGIVKASNAFMVCFENLNDLPTFSIVILDWTNIGKTSASSCCREIKTRESTDGFEVWDCRQVNRRLGDVVQVDQLARIRPWTRLDGREREREREKKKKAAAAEDE
jgi:hypothetical protein